MNIILTKEIFPFALTTVMKLFLTINTWSTVRAATVIEIIMVNNCFDFIGRYLLVRTII